jgi:hypothetical protein
MSSAVSTTDAGLYVVLYGDPSSLIPNESPQETSYKPVVTTKTKTHHQEDEKTRQKTKKILKNSRGGCGVAGAGHVGCVGRRFEYDHERSYGKYACPI